MRYNVSGKQIDIGESLSRHVRESLGETVEKYAQRATDATVVFSRSGHEFVCETVVHLSTGLNASARGRSPEIYESFERCSDKMEKQLRRYKRRLKSHHKERPNPVESYDAPSFVLAPSGEDAAEPETLQPVVIAEMQTKIQSLTVGEAVMQMELSGSEFLVFRNEADARLNVVYTRDDGNIGWINPNFIE